MNSVPVDSVYTYFQKYKNKQNLTTTYAAAVSVRVTQQIRVSEIHWHNTATFYLISNFPTFVLYMCIFSASISRNHI